jgi:hypothetical protein
MVIVVINPARNEEQQIPASRDEAVGLPFQKLNAELSASPLPFA